MQQATNGLHRCMVQRRKRQFLGPGLRSPPTSEGQGTLIWGQRCKHFGWRGLMVWKRDGRIHLHQIGTTIAKQRRWSTTPRISNLQCSPKTLEILRNTTSWMTEILNRQMTWDIHRWKILKARLHERRLMFRVMTGPLGFTVQIVFPGYSRCCCHAADEMREVTETWDKTMRLQAIHLTTRCHFTWKQQEHMDHCILQKEICLVSNLLPNQQEEQVEVLENNSYGRQLGFISCFLTAASAPHHGFKVKLKT